MPRLHWIAALGICVAGASMAPGAQLCEGERLGTEWLSESGVDTIFDRGRPQFSDSKGSGGYVSVVEFPEGSGNKALRIDETTEGAASNRASSYRMRVNKGTAGVKRINEILARPEGEPPVHFVLSFKTARLARASRFIFANVNIEYGGRKIPTRFVLVGARDMTRDRRYRVGGEAFAFDNGAAPGMRFLVTPSGGERSIDVFDIRFDVRVDGSSSPESFIVDDLALHEIVTPRPAARPAGTIRFVGSAGSNGFLEAARALDLRLLSFTGDMSGEADVYVVNGSPERKENVEPLEKALSRGASVVFAVPGLRDKASEPMQALLPVNTWSMKDRIRRYDAGVVAKPGSDLARAAGGTLRGLAVGWRFDLHLPFAPIESAEHRYHWVERAKPILNTDWRVQMTTALDGRLPILVTGRTGPGAVAVFAADLYDPTLVSCDSYGAFARALLTTVMERDSVPKASAAPSVALSIERHQPEQLAVRLSNKGRSTAEVLLSYKVSNWARELMNVATKRVRVPAGRAVSVKLDERHPDRSTGGVATSADGAIPMRRVHAAVATLDRATVIDEKRADVLTASQVTLAVEEDTSTYADMKGWPGTAGEDGYQGYRYVYRPGVKPKIAVKIRNALCNLAPLATATDLGYRENTSTQGINDLSYSHGSLRGKLPLQGAWSGKSAKEQRVALSWRAPVTIAAHRICGMGSYRNWKRSNPVNHALLARTGSDEAEITTTKDAEFVVRHGSTNAYYAKGFAPARTDRVTLHVTGLDPKLNHEPRHIIRDYDKKQPVNCTVLEWEVYGWPHEKAPASARGRLTITAHDLVSGRETTVLDERVDVAALSELVRTVELPARDSFGPVRADILFEGNGLRAANSFDVLFVPGDGRKLLDKESQHDWQQGLLCTPGWVHINDFGKGMRDHTRGWGGPHDQVWALTHNLMETGTRNRDSVGRMLTTGNRVCHYTNPWRTTPDGVYSWTKVIEEFIDNMKRGPWTRKGKKVHIVGSDRWNGINVGCSWGWSEFILFDRHLRETTGKGLEGRSRSQIVDEICRDHGDAWQTWQMTRYADAVEASQQRFRDEGLSMTFETHGSFPFAGGELGAKLARTHIAVGTDLFWELRDQDLYWSLGTRFGVVAANPDLRSGAYCQWGWDNSDLNRYWFSNNGSVGPARRQWYATYFAGRVTHDGAFEPYHVYGFGSQGGHGTKFYLDDRRTWARTQNLMTQVRPEEACGFGIVVSWAGQERRMGKTLGGQGFGLYAGKGHEQLDTMMGHVYHKLVKNGLPVSFVTSTHALKKWNGKNPLVIVDGFDLEEWEFDCLDRLSSAGTPVFAIGQAASSAATERAARFYGVVAGGEVPTPSAGTRAAELSSGQVAFVRPGEGRAPVVLVPRAGKQLSGRAAADAVRLMLEQVGDPVSLPPGVAATTMASNGSLFLLLGDQGDVSREVTIALRPSWFVRGLEGDVKVIDLDRAGVLGTKRDAKGRIEFTVPVPAAAGRAVLVTGGAR